MRGYKAFNGDLTCRGFQYEIGKTYTLEDPDSLEICENGFHFCTTIGACYSYYSPKDATRMCEVEALGEIQKSDGGDKMVTDKIKIIREITGPEKRGNLTEQDGYCNTGGRNTGNHNSGCSNSGDWNSGKHNSGCRNSGNWNTGNHNSGNWNTGNHNSGNDNTGNGNAGNGNDGNGNAGNGNDGNGNAGNGNAGNGNTGDWNPGNWSAGCFNTHRNPTIKMFNKLSDWTMRDWRDSDACYVILRLMSKEGNKQSRWDKLSEEDKATVMSLPNFDADIFYECTGIRV